MKFTVICTASVISLICLGCAHDKKIAFDLDRGSYTQGGLPISEKRALSYLEASENSESVITVYESGIEPRKMKVSEFLDEASRIIEAINAYYFPDGVEHHDGILFPNPSDPFALTNLNQTEQVNPISIPKNSKNQPD